MQRRWALIVAAVLGLLAVFLVNVYLQQQKPAPTKKVMVLVAAKEISKGATIDYEMLAMQAMPREFVQPGALPSRESAVGKTALATIMAGEQVLATKLTAPEPGGGLTLAVKTPPGKRAFTLGIDAASAVGGMIGPGDHVDVLAIFTNPAITITLFQDVTILAVGQQMVAAGEGRRQRDEGIGPSGKGDITLALSPQEVQILTVAMEQGKIRLSLRPRGEVAEALPRVDLSQLPAAVDLNTLLQFYIRRIGPPPPSVEVIRGLKKEVTTLPPK